MIEHTVKFTEETKVSNQKVSLEGVRHPHRLRLDFGQKVWVAGKVKARIQPLYDDESEGLHNIWWEDELRPAWWAIPVSIKGSICYVHWDLLTPRATK